MMVLFDDLNICVVTTRTSFSDACRAFAMDLITELINISLRERFRSGNFVYVIVYGDCDLMDHTSRLLPKPRRLAVEMLGAFSSLPCLRQLA